MTEDYYKILNVKPDASKEEIESAYKLALEIYTRDSIATYSILDSEGKNKLIESINIAYQTLINDRSRKECNMLIENIFRGNSKDNQPKQEKSPEEEYYDVAIFTGEILKGIRIKKGIELDKISDWTKISKQIWKYIEEDNYSMLPPPVYLRGFLKQYSEYLGLNPNKVIPTYMEKYDEYKKGGRRQKS